MEEGKNIFLINLGNQVRKKRNEIGLTQAELSRRIFKDKQSVERVENGKVNPSIFYLKEIAKGLEVSLAELLSDL